MPQLLVSVRNTVEAIAAIDGGADIIDVKEPTRGSLGCAEPELIREIAAALRDPRLPLRPLSLALGELSEWESGQFVSCVPSPHGTSTRADVSAATDGELKLRSALAQAAAQFLKLGLANVVSTGCESAWLRRWQNLRLSIDGPHVWVAVGYADHARAAAPDVDAVLAAAVTTDCGVLLIDTFEKDGSSLLDWLTLQKLSELRCQTLQHGLKLALAGRVTPDDFRQLRHINADIIAVRGAVCDGGVRTASVSKDRVRQFREVMSAG